jgi:hypothetical protein
MDGRAGKACWSVTSKATTCSFLTLPFSPSSEVLAVILSDVLFFLAENNQKYSFFSQDNKVSISLISNELFLTALLLGRRASSPCPNCSCERRVTRVTAKASTSSVRAKRTLKCTSLSADQPMIVNRGSECSKKPWHIALKKVCAVAALLSFVLSFLSNQLIVLAIHGIPGEGIVSENEEEKKLLEARSVRLRQLISEFICRQPSFLLMVLPSCRPIAPTRPRNPNAL